VEIRLCEYHACGLGARRMVKIGRVIGRRVLYQSCQCWSELASFHNRLMRSDQELEPAAGAAIPVAVVCGVMMVHIVCGCLLCGD
jgi:hypothetical protein